MSVEELLEQALRERAAAVHPDPRARSVIAARLHRSGTARRRAAGLATGLAAAAVVVAVAVGALVLRPGDRPHEDAAGRSAPRLPGFPVPPTRFFLAVAGSPSSGGPTRAVIVRAADRAVVAGLPPAPDGELTQPQLAPDGRRVYALWGTGDQDLGYLDLLTGRYHRLVRRTGELASPVLSADGRTLAYEWLPPSGRRTAASLVVRDLRTGVERVLAGLPAGAQAVPLALSPDGSSVAFVPTDRDLRPLWIASTRGARVGRGVSVAGVACRYGGWADEPRWTSAGLYAVRHCHSPQGTVISADILDVDVHTQRARLAHRFGPGQTFFMQVVPAAGGPLFLTWDASVGNGGPVYLRNPRAGWSGRRVTGVGGLDVSGSE